MTTAPDEYGEAYDPTLDDDPRPALVTGEHVVAEVKAWREWVSVRSAGAVTFDDIVIGRFEHDPDDAPRLVLNLGWLKAAGLGLTVQNDPDVDTGRKGHVLQRPEPQPAPEPF